MSELLSPAGTSESFYASISNGCNAIYLGIDKFNARAYANNFSLDNLKEFVDFAHLRNVKIYVTMNTILYDEELNEAFKVVDELANIHVDAIIVQDLALLNYITNNYKSIEAHASTQMGIDDIYGAKIVKDLGVTRIVFARETKLSTMKEIKDSLHIEIEAFIHGALCVCYSGNCLMSSMIGERSGNRGRCAGCCRQKYSLIDKTNNKVITTGFLLSMKDLNASNFIKDMDFVDSLKIEGRMKEPTYVGGVTRFYRELLDDKHPNLNLLDKVFNRTYTKGFMNNESSSDITNIERPNNYGYLIGKVTKINKDTIWIKLFSSLNKGDQIRIEADNAFEEISVPVLKLFDANFKEVTSNSKVAVVSCHHKVSLGAKVYKTKDINFNKEVEESFKNKEYQKIPLNFKFIAHEGDKLYLTVNYKHISITDNIDIVIEKAIKASTTKDNVINQLSKLNDTPYCINKLDIDMDDNIFIPLKLINELRRNVIAKLDEARLNKKIIKLTPKEITPMKHDLINPEITVQVSNDKQYEAALEMGIKHIYYKNIVRRNNERYVDGFDEVLIGGLGGIDYYKNKDVTLVSDYSFNIVNHLALGLVSSLGVSRITLSHEINKDHINALVSNYYDEFNTYPNLELIVYGKTHLMHTMYCPLKRLGMCGECKKANFTLKDRFEEFPIAFNDDCTINILNSKTLNLMDDIFKIKGVNYFRLEFSHESKDEVKKIITTFKEILDGNYSKLTFNSKTDTRGHFIKNPL